MLSNVMARLILDLLDFVLLVCLAGGTMGVNDSTSTSSSEENNDGGNGSFWGSVIDFLSSF